jgi:SAM-dependent methyltransferase
MPAVNRRIQPATQPTVGIEQLIPPESMDFVGGNFRAIGKQFLGYFTNLCGLRQHERVLDVGCGIGRMAVPLLEYLDARGSYEGFDIVPAGIDWCRERITPRFPNFRFQVADIQNRHYNPAGTCRSDQYRFPYADKSFDFAILASVFTHMLPAAVERYTAELARVLKPGGRALVTMFLLNPESLVAVEQGKTAPALGHRFGTCRVYDADDPEFAIAYPEQDALAMFARHKLPARAPLYYGNWCGRQGAIGYQDILVVSKVGPDACRPKGFWGHFSSFFSN